MSEAAELRCPRPRCGLPWSARAAHIEVRRTYLGGPGPLFGWHKCPGCHHWFAIIERVSGGRGGVQRRLLGIYASKGQDVAGIVRTARQCPDLTPEELEWIELQAEIDEHRAVRMATTPDGLTDLQAEVYAELRKRGAASAPKLLQRMARPGVTLRTVQRLLGALRGQGLVRMGGTRRGATWHAVAVSHKSSHSRITVSDIGEKA